MKLSKDYMSIVKYQRNKYFDNHVLSSLSLWNDFFQVILVDIEECTKSIGIPSKWQIDSSVKKFNKKKLMLLSNLSNTPFPPVVVNSSKSYSEWRSSLYILGLRFIYILNASVTNGQMDDLILKEIKNLSIDHNIAIPIVNSPHSELLYYLSG